MHEVLVNRLGGLSLPRKSVDRLTDRPDMTLDVYRGRKTTNQQQQQQQPLTIQTAIKTVPKLCSHSFISLNMYQFLYHLHNDIKWVPMCDFT